MPTFALAAGPPACILGRRRRSPGCGRGATALRPQVEVLDSEFLDGAQRERLRVRLQRFVDDRDRAPTWRRCSPPSSAPERDPALRGRLHRLAEALGAGAAERRAARRCRRSDPRRAALKAIGVRGGPARAVPAGAAEAASGRDAGAAVGAVAWRAAAGAAAAGRGLARRRRRTGRPGSRPRSAGSRPGRCCCGWTSPSGWPASWPGPRAAAAPPRCRPAWPPGCRCGRSCCRWCCAASASAWCPGACWRRTSSARRRRRCWCRCAARRAAPPSRLRRRRARCRCPGDAAARRQAPRRAVRRAGGAAWRRAAGWNDDPARLV